jgi:hypothetical protein
MRPSIACFLSDGSGSTVLKVTRMPISSMDFFQSSFLWRSRSVGTEAWSKDSWEPSGFSR